MLTAVHVALSLAGIVSGVVVLAGFLSGRKLRGSNGVFLATTILTSATGFAFPFQHLLPSHIVGALSLVVLAVALYAMMVHSWRGRGNAFIFAPRWWPSTSMCSCWSCSRS
jgi:hypothetical protein